jgi:hypothetical protein
MGSPSPGHLHPQTEGQQTYEGAVVRMEETHTPRARYVFIRDHKSPCPLICRCRDARPSGVGLDAKCSHKAVCLTLI